MLCMKQMRNGLLGAVGRQRFSRISVRGKKINYEWQNQTAVSKEKPPRWMTNQEIEMEAQAKEAVRMKEDFRRELFDLNPKPEKPKVIVDEVFGTDMPKLKPFDLVTLQELFTTSNFAGRAKLQRIRMSYIQSQFACDEIYDRPIIDNFVKIEGELKTLLKSLEKEEHYLLTDAERKEFFNRPEIHSALQEIEEAIKRTNFKNLPNIVVFLADRLSFNSDDLTDVPLFETISEGIDRSFHIFNTTDLVKIFYALTTNTPKKGPMQLRRNIREKICRQDFDRMSLTDILTIYTAFRTEYNIHRVHHNCAKFLVDKAKSIEQLAMNQPGLAVDILYTYANCRPSKRYTKVMKIVNNEETLNQKEAFEMENLYMPMILKHVSQLSEEHILRLNSIMKVMNLRNYDEIYHRTQELILKNFDSMDADVLASLVYSTAKLNLRGTGGKAFWSEVAKKYLAALNSRPELGSGVPMVRISYALAKQKAFTTDDFSKHLSKRMIDELDKGKLEFNELTMCCWTALFSDLTAKNKDTTKGVARSIVRAIVFKNEWIPLVYYAPIKYFIWYFSKRQPKWNWELLENLSYHAEKKFTVTRLQKDLMTQEYLDFSSILKQQLKLELISLTDFDNLFLMDFAQHDYKFAVYYQKEEDCLYNELGEERLTNPIFDLKREILAQNGWTVCTIDASEFKSLGQDRVEWLRKKIDESFKKCKDKIKELTADRIAYMTYKLDQPLQDMIDSDPTYDEHEEIVRIQRRIEQADLAKLKASQGADKNSEEKKLPAGDKKKGGK